MALTQADVDWIRTRVEGLGYDVHDQTVKATPPREYVVIYPGESNSHIERAGQVQVRDRQSWRLMCVSRSLAVLRDMTRRVTAAGVFAGARLRGLPLGPVIVEVEVGPELEQGTEADRRYSITITYLHHQPRRNRS